jgi:hypothetical protein
LIFRTHIRLVFFLALLISSGPTLLQAQMDRGDTLKKVSTDTLNLTDEEDGIQELVIYSAEDSVVVMPLEGKAILYGNAKVAYGSLNIQSEFIELDRTKNIITAYGKKDSLGHNVGTPVFKDGEETIEAEKIIYNLKTKRGKIFNALTRQGELLVVGNEIKKDSNNIIYMKDMKCIPCQYEDSRTVFRATKAKIIPDDKIVTGPMYLEVGGVPTPLGLPFGYFPNTKKQHNGVLLPTYGNSPNFGFNLRQGGYYWGINDKTNMIIKADIYANGSWALNTTNNYNVLYKAIGNTYIGYSSFNIGDRDIPAQFSRQKSYEIRWTHAQDNKSDPSVRFSSNVNYVKNQSFNRLNAINTGQFLQNTFQSNINYTKAFKRSALSLNATHSQNSLSNQVDINFPSLTFNVNRFFPFRREGAVKQNIIDKIGISYLAEARNMLSGKDSTLFSGSLLDSLKYGVRHLVPISTNFNIFKYITASPALNLSSVMYGSRTQKSFAGERVPNVKNENVSGFAAGYDANFSTSFNTQVYFDYLFKKGKVKQIRHLLIPTLTYNYRPDFGDKRFGFWKEVQRDTIGNLQRYSIFEKGIFGGPQPGKVNGLGINLNNNIEAKIKQKTDTGFRYEKKVALQNLSLNTFYNFAADSFKMSLVSLTARTVLFKYFDVQASSGFDPYKYDKVRKVRVNQFVYTDGAALARLIDANFAVNTSVGSNMLEALRKTRQPTQLTNSAERGSEAESSISEVLEWTLRISYNLNLRNTGAEKYQQMQTLNFSGDVSPTKYWKVGVSSGYDFTTKGVSYTSLNIYRDLKCWEARVDWVPFGIRKSYSIAINLKTSILRDFKIPHQRQWFDLQ